MSAYIVVDVTVSDPAHYETYKSLAQDAIAQYGGRYLVRGGETVVLEGEWAPKRVVLLEFPDLATARRFYDSPEYQAAKRAREGVAQMSMVAAAGL